MYRQKQIYKPTFMERIPSWQLFHTVKINNLRTKFAAEMKQMSRETKGEKHSIRPLELLEV